MDSTPDPSPKSERQKRRSLLPPSFMELMIPTLQVGGTAGACGVLTGVAMGVIRDAPPVLFAAATGVQWFTLASGYWLPRSVVLKSIAKERPVTPSDRMRASTLAGATAGICGGLLRGPRNIIPGAIVFSLVGAGGQAIANRWETRSSHASSDDTPAKESWLRSKWSPLRKLTDDEYEDMIQEKILRVETEIALIDDRIAALRNGAKAADQASSRSESNDTQKPQ